jgi:DNA-directed RNA polymerase subunit M/transcription elongation factor TFIIS
MQLSSRLRNIVFLLRSKTIHLIALEQPGDADERDFAESLLRGDVAPETVATMKHEDMFSRKIKQLRVRVPAAACVVLSCSVRDLARAHVMFLLQDAAIAKELHSNTFGEVKMSSDAFQCEECGMRDVSYNLRQVLSGDEPMTVFIQCNNCGKNWERCQS